MKKTTAIILILFSLAFTFSCRGMIGKVRTSLVTVTVGKSGIAALEVKPATLAEKVKRFLARTFSLPAANAAIPAIVQGLRLTVSADDMATITASVNVAGLESADFVVEVPNGLQRRFLVEGLDGASTVQYSGEAVSDLTGDPVVLTINMVSAVQGPLIVLSTQPADGAVNVPIDTVVSALFSKPINTASIDSTTFNLKDNAGAPVAGTLLVSGSTATFTPAASLTHGARYTATITTGVKDATGNALAADFTWSFTVAADGVPPVFAGLSPSILNLSITSMQLSWAPATDNITTSANIVYLIYQATVAGGENFASPTYTTAPGATSFIVTGLTPGTTYYFAVRARDEAGNTDSNVVEKTLTYPGRYVSNSGKDANPCTQSAPCLTIEQAQTLTAINEGIFVSAGTYTLPVNGLTLATRTALACTGPNHTTVINSEVSSFPTFTGSQGVVIDGCRIVEIIATSPMITDNGTDIIVNNCILEGIANASSQGIALSGNSTVQNSTLSNFTFNGPLGDAILISGGSAVISNNTFTANGNGVSTTFSSVNPTISRNVFTGNVTGINAGGSPTISLNTISNNSSAGISIPSGSPHIIGNTIDLNGTGISAFAGPFTLTVTNNTIKNNTAFGINISTTSPVSAAIHDNSIYCNKSGDLSASVPALSSVDATFNSWDHDLTTTPPGPTITVDICVNGIDVCDPANVVPFKPFNAAVPGGCL